MAKRSVNFGGQKRWRRGFRADHILATLDFLTDDDEKKKEILEKMKKVKPPKPKTDTGQAPKEV